MHGARGRNHAAATYLLDLEAKLATAQAAHYQFEEAALLASVRKMGALAVACLEEHGAPLRP